MITPPNHISPATWTTLEALFEGEFPSRNQDYDAHEQPHVREAVRIYRYLKALSLEVTQHANEIAISLVNGELAGHFGFRIEIPTLHGCHTAYLAHEELRLLAAYTPALAELLVESLDGPSTTPIPNTPKIIL